MWPCAAGGGQHSAAGDCLLDCKHGQVSNTAACTLQNKIATHYSTKFNSALVRSVPLPFVAMRASCTGEMNTQRLAGLFQLNLGWCIHDLYGAFGVIGPLLGTYYLYYGFVDAHEVLFTAARCYIIGQLRACYLHTMCRFFSRLPSGSSISSTTNMYCLDRSDQRGAHADRRKFLLTPNIFGTVGCVRVA